MCAGGGFRSAAICSNISSDLVLGLSQTALTVTFLGYQAWLMADAILRTLARLLITHKHLLEWVTAAQAKHSMDLNLFGMYRRMVGGVIAAMAAVAAVILTGHSYALAIVAPLAALWTASPAFAYWISLPPPRPHMEMLSSAEVKSLRAIARRTWRFFETFVTAQEHSLPPDNFQEDPKPVVAHRTSPTNIGLYMLSTLAARDFQWIGTEEMADRIEATLNTLDKLDQFRGHLYNWYDTRTLRPLDPRYISSVDSGNLAGHLLALASGCRELGEGRAVNPELFEGLEDTIGLLREALGKMAEAPRTHAATRQQLSTAVDLLAASTEAVPGNTLGWGYRLLEVSARARTVADIAAALAQELSDHDRFGGCRAWAQAASRRASKATCAMP